MQRLALRRPAGGEPVGGGSTLSVPDREDGVAGGGCTPNRSQFHPGQYVESGEEVYLLTAVGIRHAGKASCGWNSLSEEPP